MSIYFSLIVALVGGILYLILQPSSTPPPAGPGTPKDRLAELCRITFGVALLAFLLVVGGRITSLLTGK